MVLLYTVVVPVVVVSVVSVGGMCADGGDGDSAGGCADGPGPGAQWSSVGTPVTQLPHMPVVPSPAQVPGHICLLLSPSLLR